MAIIGVYDYDFFHYPNVIPNLECAKILSYYRRHNNIAVLTPTFNPESFTKFILRKDYDDGIYDKDKLAKVDNYGGLAFSNNIYQPLKKEIERSPPDFSSYEKYQRNFLTYFKDGSDGKEKGEEIDFHRLFTCQHFRMSLDGKSINEETFQNFQLDLKNRKLFFHDFNLGNIRGAPALIRSLVNEEIWKRYSDPIRIGTKFPIITNSEEDLLDWLSFQGITNFSYIQFNGVFKKQSSIEKIKDLKPIDIKRILWNPVYGCSSENDFLESRLLDFFKQVLFFHKESKRISLYIEDDFFQTEETKTFFRLLKLFLKAKTFHTLYEHIFYILKISKGKDKILSKNDIALLRVFFQKVREKNYECFKLFYEG